MGRGAVERGIGYFGIRIVWSLLIWAFLNLILDCIRYFPIETELVGVYSLTLNKELSIHNGPDPG